MNMMQFSNISDWLRTHGIKFSAVDLQTRHHLFEACKLLIDAQRMIECTDRGPNELSDNIAKFIKDVGGYQTWNPPQWVWKEEWEEGKDFKRPPQKLDENLNPTPDIFSE